MGVPITIYNSIGMRNNKGQFTKGHASLRKKIISLELVEWECVACGVFTSKTREQLHYRKTVPKYCSIACVYKNNPRKGAITPESTKEKLRVQKLGNKNPSWAGGVTPLRVKIRNTPEYKEWRTSVFTRDDYTCKVCKVRGGKLEADHVIPYMKDKAALLDVNNGQTLCKSCHRIKSTEELKQNWVNQYSSAKNYGNVA